jgi:hypothetical protein
VCRECMQEEKSCAKCEGKRIRECMREYEGVCARVQRGVYERVQEGALSRECILVTKLDDYLSRHRIG